MPSSHDLEHYKPGLATLLLTTRYATYLTKYMFQRSTRSRVHRALPLPIVIAATPVFRLAQFARLGTSCIHEVPKGASQGVLHEVVAFRDVKHDNYN